MPDNPSEPGQELVPAGRDPDDESEISARDIIALDRERLQVARRMFDMFNEANQRDFQVNMAHLENEKLQQQADERHNRRMYRLLSWASIVFFAVVVFFIWMMFFGDERQSSMAARALKAGVQAIGSAGVLIAIWTAVKRLLRRR